MVTAWILTLRKSKLFFYFNPIRFLQLEALKEGKQSQDLINTVNGS